MVDPTFEALRKQMAAQIAPDVARYDQGIAERRAIVTSYAVLSDETFHAMGPDYAIPIVAAAIQAQVTELGVDMKSANTEFILLLATAAYMLVEMDHGRPDPK